MGERAKGHKSKVAVSDVSFNFMHQSQRYTEGHGERYMLGEILLPVRK